MNHFKANQRNVPSNLGPYKRGKLRGTRHKCRNSAINPASLVGQDSTKKCVQYEFKFTQVYGAVGISSKTCLWEQMLN